MVRRKQKKAIQAQDVGSSSLSNSSARTTSATDGAHFLLTAMGRALPDLSDIRDVEHLQKYQASRSDETISSILDHLAQLKKLVLPEDGLESHGYALHSLNGDELEDKKRCQGCGKTMSQFRKRAREMKKPRKEPEPERSAGFPTQGVLEGGNEGCARDDPSTGKTQGPILRCKFHVGVLENKLWSCCGQRPSAPPCSGSEHHIPRQYPPGAFERSWQIWPTPIPKSLKKIRLAVAIDCEMGTAASGDSELIRVTLVDYFTSDVLVDDLVFPDVPMRELRTRFSGVTWSALQNARRKGKCIFGRDNARKAVWEFVGPNTIVVGHSAHHDLLALRWAHRAIVDTYQLEALKPPKTDAKIASDGEQPAANLNADTSPAPACGSEQKREPKRPSPMSLKGLALAKLGRDIQTAGKQGHDSLEDAIATRDLARWVVCTSQGWDGDAECLPSTDMLGG